MSRILEFQPTDEQTVVARVLVELHQAIDIHFPGATPSARQFTKTVLTNQGGESTRVDNVPTTGGHTDRQETVNQGVHPSATEKKDVSQLSMTPKSGHAAKKPEAPLQTEELRRLMGETTLSRRISRLLMLGLVAGVVFFALMYFGVLDSVYKRGN